MKDLKQIKEKHISVLAPEFSDMDVAQLKACVTYGAALDRDQVPSLSSSNGFTYPPYPTHWPPLDCISERLMVPALPFMETRRSRYQTGGYGIVGQVITVLVDVNDMVTALPRQLGDDYSFNVHFKRNLIHKITYLQSCIKRANI
jgi:hypothetical protein